MLVTVAFVGENVRQLWLWVVGGATMSVKQPSYCHAIEVNDEEQDDLLNPLTLCMHMLVQLMLVMSVMLVMSILLVIHISAGYVCIDRQKH